MRKIHNCVSVIQPIDTVCAPDAVLDEEECDLWANANAFSISYRQHYDDRPSGCVRNDNGHSFIFNYNLSGQPNSFDEPICKVIDRNYYYFFQNF